jgi:hypothetical protein
MTLFNALFGNAFSTPFANALRDVTPPQRTEIVTYTKRYTRKGVRIVPLEVRALPGNSRGKARR